MEEGIDIPRKILVVHDHQVPAVSDRLQHELKDGWSVVGVKYFDEAMCYLQSNDDIFALISDGEIPETSLSGMPALKYGDYLVRWLAKKGENSKRPYLIIQWTTYEVSAGPSDDYPIFRLSCTSEFIGIILKAWLNLLDSNRNSEYPLRQVMIDSTLKRYLRRGRKSWNDITHEQKARDALAFIHNARHKAISCYLAIYNDLQNLEYWSDQSHSNDTIINKIDEAVQRIKRNAISIRNVPSLGGLTLEGFNQVFTDKLGENDSTASLRSSYLIENNIELATNALLASIEAETHLREICEKLTEGCLQVDMSKNGGSFIEYVTVLQDKLEIIVNAFELIFKR